MLCVFFKQYFRILKHFTYLRKFGTHRKYKQLKMKSVAHVYILEETISKHGDWNNLNDTFFNLKLSLLPWFCIKNKYSNKYEFYKCFKLILNETWDNNAFLNDLHIMFKMYVKQLRIFYKEVHFYNFSWTETWENRFISEQSELVST